MDYFYVTDTDCGSIIDMLNHNGFKDTTELSDFSIVPVSELTKLPDDFYQDGTLEINFDKRRFRYTVGHFTGKVYLDYLTLINRIKAATYINIGEHEVEFLEDGIKIGCQHVSFYIIRKINELLKAKGIDINKYV